MDPRLILPVKLSVSRRKPHKFIIQQDALPRVEPLPHSYKNCWSSFQLSNSHLVGSVSCVWWHKEVEQSYWLDLLPRPAAPGCLQSPRAVCCRNREESKRYITPVRSETGRGKKLFLCIGKIFNYYYSPCPF